MPITDIIYYAFIATCTYMAVRATILTIRTILYNLLSDLEHKLKKKRNGDVEARAKQWCKDNPIEVDNHEKQFGIGHYESAFRHSKQFVGTQTDLFPRGSHIGPVGMG